MTDLAPAAGQPGTGLFDSGGIAGGTAAGRTAAGGTVAGRIAAGAFDFDAYQAAATLTASLVRTDHAVVYPTLGLVNEAGEVAGKVKKIFRDRQGVITDADRASLAAELGDVLWYLSEICTRLGLRLEDVATGNIAKLADRASRGVIGGDGDHR